MTEEAPRPYTHETREVPQWMRCPDVKTEGHIFDITVECRNPNTAELMTMGSCELIRLNRCCPRHYA